MSNIFPRGRLRTCAPGSRLPRWEDQSRIHGESPEELRFHVESRRREKKQYHARTACVSFIAEGESSRHEGDSGNGSSGPEWEAGVLLGWRGRCERMGWEGGGMAYGAYLLEAFSPGVEKRLQVCRFFESKKFGVCNAFSTPGLNASIGGFFLFYLLS